jgi:Neuraminidase (sialidase)
MKWLLLCASELALAAGLEAPFEFLVAPSTEGNRRNSEADMIALKNGKLMLVWTEFYTSQGSDWGSARLAAMWSSDGGRTWKDKATLQENIGQMNVMEPDLLRLRSGKILFVFVRKNSEGDCAPMVRFSTNDGKSFSPPRPIPIDPSPSYTGSNHDRMIQLRSGRVVLPLWYTPDYRVDRHIRTRVYYSDDEGRTWKASRTLVDLPDSKAGAQEPGIVELKDGRLFMWIRTDTGKIYRSYSGDRGESWSQPEPMAVDSPLSPQSIKRIPSTGDLLLVWNNSPKVRTPLTAAISRDDGQTWTNFRNLDDTPGHTFAYTSIEFLPDRALFTYYVGPPPGGRASDGWSLKLKAVPAQWFYQ